MKEAMKTNYLVICEKAVHETAKDYFFKIAATAGNKNSYEKMCCNGMELLPEIYKRIHLKCAYVCGDTFEVEKNMIRIGNYEFQCNVMEKLDLKNIKKIYAYVATSGNYHCPSDTLSEAYYADTWGTAYINAVRDYLRSYFSKLNVGGFVLDSFGPGYYGMPLEEVKQFFQMINTDGIGVSCKTNGLMLPLKSVVGLNLVMAETVDTDIRDCETCIGDVCGCEFCKSNTGR